MSWSTKQLIVAAAAGLFAFQQATRLIVERVIDDAATRIQRDTTEMLHDAQSRAYLAGHLTLDELHRWEDDHLPADVLETVKAKRDPAPAAATESPGPESPSASTD